MVRHVSRLHHLITLAERVLACYNLHEASFTLVSETANAVFHVVVPSGRPPRLLETGRTSDGAAYALRLRPPGWHRTQAIAEELQWLLALRRDTDLVVPEPVPACDGTLIQEISAPDTPEPWHGVLFRWVPGERRTETLTPPDLERVGTCMARLHQHAAAFVTAQHPPLTRRARFCDVRAWRHGFLPAVAVYAPRDLAVFAVAAQWVQTACQAVEASLHGVGFIHADLHQWNYLFHGEEVRVASHASLGTPPGVRRCALLHAWPTRRAAHGMHHGQDAGPARGIYDGTLLAQAAVVHQSMPGRLAAACVGTGHLALREATCAPRQEALLSLSTMGE